MLILNFPNVLKALLSFLKFLKVKYAKLPSIAIKNSIISAALIHNDDLVIYCHFDKILASYLHLFLSFRSQISFTITITPFFYSICHYSVKISINNETISLKNPQKSLSPHNSIKNSHFHSN